MGVSLWAADPVEISPSNALNDGGVDPITIVCAKGDGTSNPAISGGQLRLYQAGSGKTTGNTITFSSTYSITSIVFTFANNMTASNGSFSDGTYDSGTSTWSGSTNSLTLTVTGTTSGTRIYITNMVVTYDDGGSTPTCALPTFSPAAGEYEGTQNVTITSTAGATIYYTTDGTDPKSSGTKQTYSAAIPVSANATLKAYAVKAEYDDSEVATAAYTITEGPDVTIDFTSNTEWAFPTDNTLDEDDYSDGTYTVTVKGEGSGKGYKYSSGKLLIGQNGAYLILPEFASPIEKIVCPGVSGASGSVKWNVYDGETAVSTQVTGCTSDVTFEIDPQEANKQYTIKVESAHNLQIAKIKIFYGAAPAVAKPTFSVDAGTYVGTQSVTLACTTEGSTIYYTTDGTTPDNNSTEYTGAISVSASQTIKAIAYVGSDASGVATAEYTILTPQTTMDDIFAVASANEGAAKSIAITFNNWVVSGAKGNTAYVTDGTKGFIVYYSGHGFNEGDILSGTAIFTIKLFNGAAELTAKLSGTVTANTGGTAQLNELDADAISTLSGINTGSLIKISGEATAADVVAGVTLYKTIYPESSLPSLTVGHNYNCTGVYVQFNSTKEMMPRKSDDIAEIVDPGKVATPTFDPAAGEYDEAKNVTITCETEDAIIYYTIDGTDPSTTSSVYSTAIAVTETTTIKAFAVKDGMTDSDIASATYTISEPDTRHVANSPATFTTVSGDMTPNDITFASYQGGANTAPANYNSGVRLYQKSGSNTFGGFITLTAIAGCTIDEVQITTTSTYSTSVAYSVDGNETLSESASVAASSSYTTGTGLSASSVNILNMGSGSSGRLEIASIKVYYTGEPASIHHYELGGTYQTAFMQNDEFNHTGLIVYAAYDALGENKVDITASCTFSDPDMSTTGAKTIEITYNEAVVKTYEITVNADSRKVANSPATFTTVSGDMTPNDITFAAYQGGASTAPANYNDGIRLYQAPSEDAIGGFITLKAKKGCTIDQVKITTTNTYATTVAYSVDGNENLLGSESVAKSSEYTTPSGLNKESVNIVNKGTGSNGRLEIASIKVWYTGDPLAVDHYILGGTYETTFEQYGTFNYDGLTVTAAYNAGETITEAVTGFTVEADLNTAGAAKANVMLNSVKIAEYDITVTASAKTDPALAYDPTSVILTFGQSLSAPTFSNTYNVSPITYSSDKPAVATIDAEGNIALAGGTGVAVITASFAENDDYIASEATFTITVNEPTEDLSGTWVLATAVPAIGDKFIVAGTYNNVTKTMGAQNANNRAAVESSLSEGVLTPGEGTKVFTLVDAGEGKFAIQASNGKYLSAAGTGTNNYLHEVANYEAVNAQWTISISEGFASVVASSSNRNDLQYNKSNPGLFSCYATNGQTPIQFFVLQAAPAPEYETVRGSLTSGNYYTVCYNKTMNEIRGASLWQFIGKDASLAYLEQASAPYPAGKPYILYAESDKLEAVLEGDAVEESAIVANGALHGTFSPMNQAALTAAGDNIYLVIGNQLRRVDGQTGNTLPAYRAYVDLDEIDTFTPMPGKKYRSMGLPKQTPTGIDNAEASDQPMKVLINGQLFILRGEKMYDATGRLVK